MYESAGDLSPLPHPYTYLSHPLLAACVTEIERMHSHSFLVEDLLATCAALTEVIAAASTNDDLAQEHVTLVADPHALPRLDGDSVIEHLLEDAAGLAGVLATASLHESTEQDDLRYAVRLLSEYLKATLVLWREWREQQEAAPLGQPHD